MTEDNPSPKSGAKPFDQNTTTFIRPEISSKFMLNSEDPAKINMQGIHGSLTPALQQSIQQKFASLLRHEGQIVRINVRLHKDQKLGHEHHYTATAQVELRGPDLVAHADDRDAYAALNRLAQKLDQLLDRKHGRQKDSRNHPHEIDLTAQLPKVQSEEIQA